jgi:hypothetical protein
MAQTKFNARHGLSVGSSPIDVIADTGVISSASIPPLDASKITTGTIDAARLPSTSANTSSVFIRSFLLMGA